MKGFIRILESIIASIIILSSITFFFSPSIKKLGWEDTNLHIEMHDSLESLYNTGRLAGYIRNNDANGLSSELSSLIKKNIDFSVSVSGIPNRQIAVSCLCTDEEKSLLESTIFPQEFKYHDRAIRIGVEKAEVSQNSILMRKETNVLFIFGYKNLVPYRNQLSQFLSSGGSVFMLADLTHDQVNDGYMNDTFRLAWKSGSPSSTGEFYDDISPSNTSFRISKYFSNFTGIEKVFRDFHTNNIDVDDNSIIVDQSREFSFVKTNSISSKGRVVWFSEYNMANPDERNTSLLLKSAIMWSSGELYNMDPIKKNVPQSSGAASIEIYDKDPYIVTVDYWKIF